MRLVINFFKALLDPNGNVYSKKLAGLMCVSACVIAFLSNLYFGFIVDHTLFDSLLIFAGACFSLNAFLSAKGMGVKENVATNMVDSDKVGANEDAKEVIQSPRP